MLDIRTLVQSHQIKTTGGGGGGGEKDAPTDNSGSGGGGGQRDGSSPPEGGTNIKVPHGLGKLVVEVVVVVDSPLLVEMEHRVHMDLVVDAGGAGITAYNPGSPLAVGWWWRCWW